jgi:polyisoprenoid-binding protein YceI
MSPHGRPASKEDPMSVEALQTGKLPTTRTWTVDPRHSSIRFSVKHHAVATYGAGFGEFEGQYDAAARTFSGAVQAGSVQTFEMLRNELVGPQFFDAEQYPEISFVSTSVEEDGGTLAVEGDLTIKGVTKRVRGTGAVIGPSTVAHYDGTVHDHIGVDLELTIDRRDFGIDFNNELVAGGLNLSWDVKIALSLELSAPTD